MNKLKQVVCTITLIMFGMLAKAQTATGESRDIMRSNGKIYVVMAVVVTIVLGLFLYLTSLDRKISKLERNKP